MKKKQLLVLGTGQFGTSVARTAFDLGHDVLVIDRNEAEVQSITPHVTRAAQADAASEEVLQSLGVPDFDLVVVAFGQELQASIMASLVLKELGARFIVAKAQNELHGKVLEKIGVDQVVFPERDMGHKLVHSLIKENIIDLIELSPDYSVVEVVAPPELVDRSLQETSLRARFGVNVIALRKPGGQINLSPSAGDMIRAGDVIVAIGNNKALHKMGWL